MHFTFQHLKIWNAVGEEKEERDNIDRNDQNKWIRLRSEVFDQEWGDTMAVMTRRSVWWSGLQGGEGAERHRLWLLWQRRGWPHRCSVQRDEGIAEHLRRPGEGRPPKATGAIGKFRGELRHQLPPSQASTVSKMHWFHRWVHFPAKRSDRSAK